MYNSPINSGFKFPNVFQGGNAQNWLQSFGPNKANAQGQQPSASNFMTSLPPGSSGPGGNPPRLPSSNSVNGSFGNGGYAGSPENNPYWQTSPNNPANQKPPLYNPVNGQLSDYGRSQFGNNQNSSQNQSPTQNLTGYNVNVPDTTNSNVIGSGLGYADVLNARNQLQGDYQKAQEQYAKDYQNITGQEIKGQFAGDTTDYGTGMANLIKMEGTPVLTADQMRATNALNALGVNQQTAQLVNPLNNQVAPGSTAVNPITGQPAFSGMGASPSTVLSTAQTLAQQAMQYGTPQLDQNGQLDMGYYTRQAQALYGGFGQGNQFGANQLGMGGGQTPVGQMNQGGQNPQMNFNQGNQGFGSNGYGNIARLPNSIKPYALNANVGDQNLSFIDSSRVPAALQPAAQQAAAQAGIPYLDNGGVQAVYAAQSILDVVDAAKALSIRNLKSGTGGRIENSLTNWANNYLQFNPDLSNFDQLRETAAKATTALAGGKSSGFKMSLPIIDTAVANLPRASDNLETALQKADSLASLIRNAINPLFPQVNNSGLLGQRGSVNQRGTGGNLLYSW